MPSAQKLRCRVESVVDHGDRVYTVVLRPHRPAPRVRAGQFLHLARGPAAPFPGRVSVDRVWPQLRNAAEADYYISGPPAMLQTIARDLRIRGIAADRIHIDAWE